jgi:thioredoxin 1
MLTVTDANFETEVLKSDIPVIVDFFAEWCGPCKMMSPIFEEVATKYEGKVNFVKLNVDEARESAMKYSVMSIPTIITYKGGEVVETLVGLQDEDSLAAKADGLAK